MHSVEINNLTKTYPPKFPRLKKLFGRPAGEPVEALKCVTLAIDEGEIFGLIGRNGAGKTTLTKIIATLVQPTGGSVSVRGFDTVRDEVQVRSLIGLATAEERSFYWRLSCEQNLKFFARLYGMNDRATKQKIGEVLARVNLTGLAKRRFSELSTGNKQRLAVARALLSSPPVLLLDEPTRSLDPLAAADMRELIASLENVSVLLTSHNLSEIEQLCRRVAVISNGEIRAVDTAENLRRRHKLTQTVKIYLNGGRDPNWPASLPALLNDWQLNRERDFQVLIFKREPDDARLGETIRFLTAKGAKILDVETEKATLLDVLESFE